MSKVITTAEARVEKVILLDCGQASKVTKGMPFFVMFEVGFPPFDRLLL